MGSSAPAAADRTALRRLGAFLTGAEARELADRLGAGDTLTAALRAIGGQRRGTVRELLDACGLGPEDAGRAVAVLGAIEGAHSSVSRVHPLWTMPGHLAQEGPLTTSAVHLVDGARQSVTCCAYNFQTSSGMWAALQQAAGRSGVQVRLYLDGAAADAVPRQGSPTSWEVADHLRPAVVLRSRRIDGGVRVRNHAKFLAVDHRFLLVTSANLSWSAEHGNVELGVLLDDRALTESVERQMRRAEDLLYERVGDPQRAAGSAADQDA